MESVYDYSGGALCLCSKKLIYICSSSSRFVCCIKTDESKQKPQEGTAQPLSMFAASLDKPSATSTLEAGEDMLPRKTGIAVLEDLMATDTSVSLLEEGEQVTYGSPLICHVGKHAKGLK